MENMMPSVKNKRAKKVSKKPENRLRRMATEISRCEKKLAKLLGRYESGIKRWTLNKKGNKVDRKLNKLQGIVTESKRHKALHDHIASMKNHLQKLKNG